MKRRMKLLLAIACAYLAARAERNLLARMCEHIRWTRAELAWSIGQAEEQDQLVQKKDKALEDLLAEWRHFPPAGCSTKVVP